MAEDACSPVTAGKSTLLVSQTLIHMYRLSITRVFVYRGGPVIVPDSSGRTLQILTMQK